MERELSLAGKKLVSSSLTRRTFGDIGRHVSTRSGRRKEA